MDYAETNLGSNQFTAGGVAQNWRSYNSYWNMTLPFAFSFYGTSYTSVSVSSDGLLAVRWFGYAGDSANSTAKLVANARIAPLWANIRTDKTGDNIFVTTSIPGQVTIRWAATNAADNTSPVNFSVTLFNTGAVRFDYGAGNANLSPTIGISRGDGRFYDLSTYNGQNALANVNSVQFATAPVAYVDIGCYEFQGSTLNTTPPQVVATTPTIIDAGGDDRHRVQSDRAHL